MSFIVPAALLLFLKLAMVAGIARCVRHLFPDSLACASLAGWLAVQALQLVGMAGLSAFHLLAPAAWWGWTALELLIVFALARKTRAPLFTQSEVYPFAGWRVFVALLLLITTLLFFRAVFFFDGCADSNCYGLVRLGYYIQHRSIFAQESGRVLRMICYEWNAELNALNYGLLTGTDRGFALAGVERWWVAVVAVFALARAMGNAVGSAAWIGLVICASPAIFNLAGVTKGDVPATAALVCALAHLLRMRGVRLRDPDFAMAFLWLAFGAGCKGNMAPVFALFVFLAAIFRCRELRPAPPNLVAAIAIGALASPFALRHAVNTLVFHNPLQRTPLESCAFSIGNLPGAWESQWSHFLSLGGDLVPAGEFASAMVRGLGVTGWLALLVLVPAWKRRPQPIVHASQLPFVFAAGLGAIWLYLCGLFPVVELPEYREHMFRFFLPFLVPLVTAIFCRYLQGPIGDRRGFWTIACGLAVSANLFFAFKPSEIMASRGLKRLGTFVLHHDQFSSRLNEEFEPGARASLGSLPSMRGRKLRLLILRQGDEADLIYPFFGDCFEWNCGMVWSLDELRSRLAKERFDRVVLTRSVRQLTTQFAPEPIEAVRKANYTPEAQGPCWEIFRP